MKLREQVKVAIKVANFPLCIIIIINKKKNIEKWSSKSGVLKLLGARDPSKGRTFSEDLLIIASQIKPYRLVAICNVICFWTLLL